MPIATNDLDRIGDEDLVSITVGDEGVSANNSSNGRTIVESYEVKISTFQQPSAFALRVGQSETTAALLKKFVPGKNFVLHVGETKIQTGTIYDCGVPSMRSTLVELHGRDYVARLFDDDIQDELSFDDKTYYDLTRRVLNVVGLREEATRFKLFTSNEANRALVSRARNIKKRSKKPGAQIVEEIQTGVGAGGGKLVQTQIQANVGTSYYSFLQDQYKLAGLFLLATADGNFVLFQPNADQEPAYKVIVQEDQPRGPGRAIDRTFNNKTTQRHSACIVYGRGGTGTEGRHRIRGYYVDEEMSAYGFDHVRTVYDQDVKSEEQANYVARRWIAEERRQGWQLEYTLSGHILPSTDGTGGYLVWAPDMVCDVQDDQLDIHGKFYIQEVTFRRNPQMTTTISLMRPRDLVFAEGLF
jgi:prophage tail gpP-like protein